MRRLLLCLFLFATSIAGWAQPQLYWSKSSGGSSGEIRRSNLDGSGSTLLVSSGAEIWSLEIDGVQRKLYYIDNSTIKRSNLDGTGVETLGFGSAQDITLDLTNSLIYWADSTSIKRASLGGGAATTVHTGSDYIYGLALDLGAQRLYFADHGGSSPTSGAIRYLSLAGGFPAAGTTVLQTNGTPLGLVRDGSQLYFSDYTLGTVERVGTDGSGRIALSNTLGGNVDQLALDPITKVLYVATYDSGDIHAFTPSGVNTWTQTTPITGQTRTIGALVFRGPSATTNAASAVANSSATLNGTVNASGFSTTVTFEYGLTTSYGSTATATASPVTGSTDTAVSANLTSLTMGTPYHFRVKAVNADGTTYGADQTFTTPTLTPTTTTLDSSANPSTYGQSVSLTATVVAGATGTVTFKDGATTIGTGNLDGAGVATVSLSTLTAGTRSLTAVYAGDSTYAGSTSSTLSQVVSKATPTVSTWPTATDISYGQTLASSTLTGGSGSVAGSFAFTTPGTTPALGTASQGVTFTPTDATNYNTVVGTVSVTVIKATPTVTTWPTASGITYGQTLASSTLSGGSGSVAGSFAFTTPTTAPNAGTASQGVTFTPTDTTNYNTVAGSLSVTVAKATTTITTAPTAAGITYGQTLADATLSGGAASVPGTFAFTTPSTAPNAGTASHGVTFTPTDSTNYNNATGSVSVSVAKATPTVTTWPTASTISYGQTLASSTLTGGSGSVAGSFAFTTPGTTPAVGTASQGVTFTPTDATNYNTVAGSVSVTVIKATPTVTTWPTASGITYGETLASSTLTGGSGSVAGSFAFTTPTTAPNAGTASQSVTFTPTDTTNYNTVVGSVSVTVAKATPTISTLPTVAGITYGQTLASATLSGGSASVPGTFVFTTPTTAPGTGTATHSVTFTPTDTTNYNTTTGTVSVVVSKATPTVSTWPTASTISYGQTLASSTLTGGSGSVAGSFAFTTPTTAPNAGTASQGVTFTPTDTTNYNTVAGTVSVTVIKATPTVTTWPTASAITYGQTLASSTLTGGSGSVAGSFAFTTPTTSPSAGTASQGVTFTPTDTANFNTVAGSVSVTVNQASTTTVLASSANPSGFTQSITLTATVTSGATGTVTFMDGASTLGTGTLIGTTATLTTSALTVGGHNLTAVYDGDSNYLTSTSSIVVQNVVLYAITGSAGTSGVTLSYTDGTAKTVTSGAGGTYTVSVPYDWSGTITPSKTGYTFSAAKSYTLVRADVPAQDYTVSLDAPTAPTFGSITSTGFTASWTGNSAATGYRVDVATDAGFTALVQTDLSATGTTLAITGLTPSTTYYFRVRATDGSLTSANVASAALLTLPAAPVALAATSMSATAFTANWQAVTGATGYKLTVATAADFSSILSGYNAKVVTGTSEALSGLAVGTTFYYRLVATNATGDGPVSNTITVSLIPLAPVANAATAVTSTGFTAEWQASAGATGYRLDVASDPAFTSLVTGYANLDAGNTTSRAVAGLIPNKTYYFRVRATNGAGTSPASNVVTVQTLTEAPLAETLPAMLVAMDGATLQGQVTANNQVTVVSFDLGTDMNSWTSLRAEPGSVSGMTRTAVVARATGLAPRTRYYVRLVATNATGMTYGETLSFTTPGAPIALSSVNPGTAAIGSLVTLSGSGFTGATSVVIGGMEAVFIVVSDTEILAVVPPGARSGVVRVTSPSGTAESASSLIVKTEG